MSSLPTPCWARPPNTTAQREAQRRSLPPTKCQRQVAPGSPAEPDRHSRTSRTVRRAVQLASAATPHKPIPGHHQGSPHKAATKSQQTARTPNGHCLDIIPKRHRNTDTKASPSATPQTPEPPANTAASEREAVGGMRCCGGVLKRGNWGKQKAQKHPNAKPTPQTPEPPAHATTPKTKWCVACGAAGVCRGAGETKGKAHDNVTTAPGTEPPDKRVYISMRAKSSSPPRTARHTSQSE